MDASTVVETCKDKELLNVINFSILSDSSPLPPNRPPEQLKVEQLLPPTPCIWVGDRREAFSMKFQDSCMSYPIVVIRGLTQVLNMDLRLFWREDLMINHPTHFIRLYRQIKQNSSFENWDMELNSSSWFLYNIWDSKYQTIEQYAQYQGMEQEEMIQAAEDPEPDLEVDGNREIYLAAGVYLLNEPAWQPQLQELRKLPSFLQTGTSDNMLRYAGREIMGMNIAQLRMMVCGCRITGRQENNNFCAVNINVGMGECEWFAVSSKYWSVIQSLCERNGVDYLRDKWWPANMMEVIGENVPVYNFRQRAGDLVWINVGCVYWVQSQGWCNNIAWNVGPLIHQQYQSAIERYEWNKITGVRSMVPMIHLSWNIAREVQIYCPRLYELIKTTLLLTLKQCCLLLEFIDKKNMVVYFDENRIRNIGGYCDSCDVELFNILFVHEDEEEDEERVGFCFYCAMKQSPSFRDFICLQEYDLYELMAIYDNFSLYFHDASSISSVVSSLPSAEIMSSSSSSPMLTVEMSVSSDEMSP